MAASKLRRGLIADVRWIFREARAMQGAYDPDAIEENQRWITAVEREVLKLLRGATAPRER
jgi:hypothetical protein